MDILSINSCRVVFVVNGKNTRHFCCQRFFNFLTRRWIGSERTGFGWIENGLGDEVFTLLIIVSGIVNSFSKEKIEDELISRIRLESLSLSLFISFGLIIISTFLVYNLNYMYVLVFNLFLIILLFNLILKFRLFKHYNS